MHHSLRTCPQPIFSLEGSVVDGCSKDSFLMLLCSSLGEAGASITKHLPYSVVHPTSLTVNIFALDSPRHIYFCTVNVFDRVEKCGQICLFEVQNLRGAIY